MSLVTRKQFSLSMAVTSARFKQGFALPLAWGIQRSGAKLATQNMSPSSSSGAPQSYAGALVGLQVTQKVTPTEDRNIVKLKSLNRMNC